MPLNSAFLTTKQISLGEKVEFFIDHGAKKNATIRAKNLSGTASSSFVVRSAPLGTNEVQSCVIADAGDAMANDTGTFIISYGAYSSSAITYHKTAATLKGRVETALLALSVAMGYSTTQFRVGTCTMAGTAGAGGATIPFMFIDKLGRKDHDLLTLGSALASLTGADSVTFTQTTAGKSLGEVAYTAVEADGAASTTNTVVAFGEQVYAFGDDGSDGLGPVIQIECTAGGPISLEIGLGGVATHDLVGYIPAP